MAGLSVRVWQGVFALTLTCSALGAEAQASRATGTHRVLLIESAGEPQASASLHEALLAQFALIPAELRVISADDSALSLSERMAHAKVEADKQNAVAVFWIERQGQGTWLVHMMDSQRERVIVRRVDAAGARQEAAVEAVAVMMRESTRALIENPLAEQLPLEETPAAEPAAPTTAVRATPDNRAPATPAPAPVRATPNNRAPAALDLWQLWAAYTAQDFAAEVSFQHGVGLGVSWLGPAPWYLGVRSFLSAPLRPKAPVTVKVQRFPLTASLGYRARASDFVLDTALGLSVEVLRRHSEASAAPDLVVAEPPETRILVALEPRLRGELRVWPFLGLFAGLGADILFNQFKYISEENGDRSTLLTIRTVRPVVEVGLALYP